MQTLFNQRKDDYLKAQTEYASFVDSNLGTMTMKNQAIKENLQKEVQLAYTVYSQMASQVQMLKAKIQEKTPVYTVIESSTVPVTATSPKKILLIIAFLFLSFCATTGWLYFKRIRKDSK